MKEEKKAECYYLQFNLLVNSLVWLYCPQVAPAEEDGLANCKLAIDWAGPYLYQTMKNAVIAKLVKMDENGHIIRRFDALGKKVRCCRTFWLAK